MRTCKQIVSDLALLHDHARAVLPQYTRCVTAIAARYPKARHHKDEQPGLQLQVANIKGLYRVMEKVFAERFWHVACAASRCSDPISTHLTCFQLFWSSDVLKNRRRPI